jgi:hypothetical protein
MKTCVVGADADSLAALRTTDLEVLQGLHGLSGFQGQGEGGATISVIDAAASVPWFGRGIVLRADAVSSMPYTIMRGNVDVTESPDLVRITSLLRPLLWHAEADLVLFGAGYWFKEANEFGYNVSPRWVANHTIKPITNSRTGLSGFARTVGGVETPYPLDRFVYFWVPSYDNEVGPGAGAGQVALEAAGVLRNTDRMVAAYFKRGAIKITILSVPPNTHKDEIDKLENWWKRLASGISSAFTSIGLRSTVVPTVLGDSLKDTEAPALTEKKREDIATAMGIPQSLLWSSSAYATARHEDRLTFIEQTIIPQCQSLHEPALNAQLFGPEGLVCKFHPEKLPIMQDAQLNKATALGQLVGKDEAILTVDEARSIMGLGPKAETVASVPSGGAQASADAYNAMPTKALRMWRDAASKRVREGHSPAFEFKSDPPIPTELRAAVRAALTNAHTVGEVKSVFEGVINGPTE